MIVCGNIDFGDYMSQLYDSIVFKNPVNAFKSMDTLKHAHDVECSLLLRFYMKNSVQSAMLLNALSLIKSVPNYIIILQCLNIIVVKYISVQK